MIFQRTVTATLEHKIGNFIIVSETRRCELIDNVSNFEIPQIQTVVVGVLKIAKIPF